MFHFHERTQRRICRAGFFLLCLVPTLGVCVWAAVVQLPSQRRAAAIQLSSLLGTHVTAETVTYPRPGVTRLRTAFFSDACGTPAFAAAGQIDVRARPQTGSCSLRLDDIRLPADRLGDVATALCRAAASGDGAAPSLIVVKRLTIVPPEGDGPSEPIAIEGLRMSSAATPDGTNDASTPKHIRMQGHLSGDEADEIIRLTASQTHRSAARPIQVEFDTGNAELPCWLVAPFFPSLQCVGPKTSLRGVGRISWQKSRSKGQFAGEFRDVDFGRLTDSLPLGTLCASGAISIEHLRWDGGRLEEVRGTVRCGAGTIDRRLVDAAARALVCVQTTQESDAIPFDALAFRFSLDMSGLTLWGACESVAPGTMIVRDHQPLLGEPRYRRLPVANLVYLFVPQVPHYVPASREAQAIAGRLPMQSGTVTE